VPRRCILRIVTALLLAWIAVDLAAVDTCALDFDRTPARASLTQLDPDGASARPHAVLHPDHCFCHGLSTGVDTTATLIDPFAPGRAVPEIPQGCPLRISFALYHPPQLMA
jgi:hypothetical protein